jgi:hypothetical protein
MENGQCNLLSRRYLRLIDFCAPVLFCAAVAVSAEGFNSHSHRVTKTEFRLPAAESRSVAMQAPNQTGRLAGRVGGGQANSGTARPVMDQGGRRKWFSFPIGPMEAV